MIKKNARRFVFVLKLGYLFITSFEFIFGLRYKYYVLINFCVRLNVIMIIRKNLSCIATETDEFNVYMGSYGEPFFHTEHNILLSHSFDGNNLLYKALYIFYLCWNWYRKKVFTPYFQGARICVVVSVKKWQSQQGKWIQKHYVLACFELKGFICKNITTAHSCYVFNQF